jgi:hypothetical protein
MTAVQVDSGLGSDWTRKTWDLWLDDELVATPGQLNEYFERYNLTPEQFRNLAVYKLNLEEMPWLVYLEEPKSLDDRIEAAVIRILEKHKPGGVDHPQGRHAGSRARSGGPVTPLNEYKYGSGVNMAKGRTEVLGSAAKARGYKNADGSPMTDEDLIEAKLVSDLHASYQAGIEKYPGIKKEGEEWYPGAREFSDGIAGKVSKDDMPYAVAALSPLNDWDGNKRQASNWADMVNDRPPFDKPVTIGDDFRSRNGKLDVSNYESFVSGYDTNPKFAGKDLRGEHMLSDLPADVAALYVTERMGIKSNLNMGNDAKSIEIMGYDNADNVLKGPKTRSFGNDIANANFGDDSFAIDSWHASVLHGSKITKATTKATGIGVNQYTGTNSRYAYSVKVSQMAAQLAGYSSEESYKWQAIMWTLAHKEWPDSKNPSSGKV